MFNDKINCRNSRSAFTLVELMVTIVIISILMALILPGIGAIRRAARHRAALTQAMQIGASVRQYKMIYGKWPGQTVKGNNDATYDVNGPIIAALTNNPRDELLIEIIPASLVDGNYVDMWGSNSYVVAMDYNGDGNVDLAASLGSYNVNTTIYNEAVVVMSWGANPEDERRRVYTWNL